MRRPQTRVMVVTVKTDSEIAEGGDHETSLQVGCGMKGVKNDTNVFSLAICKIELQFPEMGKGRLGGRWGQFRGAQEDHPELANLTNPNRDVGKAVQCVKLGVQERVLG